MVLARTRNRQAVEDEHIHDSLQVISLAHRHPLTACHCWTVITATAPMEEISIKLMASRRRFHGSRSKMFVFTQYPSAAVWSTNIKQSRHRF
jgi:hypothetical protein